MDHESARDQQLTERYFLGELSDADADAFEAHYFSCAECAKDVRLTLAIVRSGSQAAEPLAAPVAPVVPMQPRRTRKIWLPYAAAAAAVIVIAVATPQLMRDRSSELALAAPLWLEEPVRGAAGPEPARVAEGELLPLIVTIPPDAAGARYELSVYRIDDGKRKRVGATKSVSKEAAEKPVLLTPRMDPGKYELVIEGVHDDGPPVEVETYPFKVIR